MDKLILTECEVCGTETEECNVTHTQDGYVCLHCFDNDYVSCDNCGEYAKKTDMTEMDDGKCVCDNCEGHYTTCDWCDDRVLRASLCEVDGCGSNVCRNCWDDRVGYCECCEDAYHNDYLSGGYCEGCEDERHMDGDYNYSYGSFTYFKTLREPRYNGNLLYFGIELEVGSDHCVSFYNLLGDYTPRIVMLTDDCSIFDNDIEYGVELVSHPATFNWLNENRNIWHDILRRLREEGVQSFTTETCGIHIHLSNNTFTHSHLYNFLKMIYENPKFTKFMSQRGKMGTRWCPLEVEAEPEMIAKKADNKSSWEKYTAVNLIHPASVEVRIFRGNLNERSFYKNIQYLHSLFMFTKDISRNDSSLTIDNYLRYVAIYKDTYKDLYEWLTEKGKINEENK